MAHEFAAWPKTTRLFRDITITEKLNGTNSGIHISAVEDLVEAFANFPEDSFSLVVDGTRYVLTAQSRKRIITPGKSTDNYGFAAWVYGNAEALVRLLGTGLHFGEWWGAGIQCGYGLPPGKRHFSLFNADRYSDVSEIIGGSLVQSVPVLYQGPNHTIAISEELRALKVNGSVAAPGFMRPEGICVYHSASRLVSKVTLDNQDAGKWEGA